MIIGRDRILLTVLVLFMLVSCSDSSEKDKQSAIDKTTEKIASEVVSSIKTPIDKAKMAQKLTDDHTRRVEEAAKQAE